MLDEPTTVRDGEELDLEKLKSYLNARLENGCRSIDVEQFPSGYSNLTYRVACDGQEYVLRRPPFGNQVKSAHDMDASFACCQDFLLRINRLRDRFSIAKKVMFLASHFI